MSRVRSSAWRFSTGRPLDIRAGGGEDEVQYNVNAPVSVDGGTGFDKLVILGTEFADDIVITAKGIFGAGLNVRYTTVEVVEVDGLEGDDEFFVQSTAFGVAYRVIGGLGSDTINVTGDVTEDIVTRELEGVQRRDRPPGDAPTDVALRRPAGRRPRLQRRHARTPASSSSREDGRLHQRPRGRRFALSGAARLSLDRYFVRLATAPNPGEVVYVTVSAARSPQEEADDLLNNPFPLVDGVGDTIWLSTSAGVPSRSTSSATSSSTACSTTCRNRALVLTFDAEQLGRRAGGLRLRGRRPALRGRPRRRRPAQRDLGRRALRRRRRAQRRGRRSATTTRRASTSPRSRRARPPKTGARSSSKAPTSRATIPAWTTSSSSQLASMPDADDDDRGQAGARRRDASRRSR